MPIKFKIEQLERTLPMGICITAHWIAEKKSENFLAQAYGSIKLPTKNPSDPTFVAYEDITEAQAIEWVKKAMGEEQLAALEANLDSQIEALKNPTQAAGVPWYEDEPEDQL